MRKIFAIIVLSVVAVAIVWAGELTGREVIEKAMKRYRGDDSILTVILTKTKMDDPSNKRRFEIKTYRISRPEVQKALVAVRKSNKPGSKPLLFLVWDWQDEKRKDQLWIGMFSQNKYYQISSVDAEKRTEQFGFSIEEMKTRDLDAATHTNEGIVKYEGERVYKVVTVPKNPKKEGFSKLVSFIRPDSWTAAFIKFVGLNGKTEKTLRVKRIEKVDGIWTEMTGEHKDFKKRYIVNFEVKRIEYNKRLPSKLFSFTELPKQVLEGN